MKRTTTAVLMIAGLAAGAPVLGGGGAPSRPVVAATAAPQPVPVYGHPRPFSDPDLRVPRASRSHRATPSPTSSRTGFPKRAARGANLSDSTGSTVWDRLADCESGGRWHYNGSSGYDGGLQFHPNTWSRKKFRGYPAYAWQATREQQIAVARRVLRESGWGQWPACSRKLGLR